jgi:hypothetical protein
MSRSPQSPHHLRPSSLQPHCLWPPLLPPMTSFISAASSMTFFTVATSSVAFFTVVVASADFFAAAASVASFSTTALVATTTSSAAELPPDPPGGIAHATADELGCDIVAVREGLLIYHCRAPSSTFAAGHHRQMILHRRCGQLTPPSPFPCWGPEWRQHHPGHPRHLSQGSVHHRTGQPSGSVQCRCHPSKASPLVATSSQPGPYRVLSRTLEG